jgi:Ca2+/H+ antiporter, TMEM165/GDT1 family
MGINGLALLIDPRYADTFPPRSLTYCSELINGKNNGMTSLNSGIFIGAFLSSGVEFLEIVAIAYALAASGFRREALFGSAVGILGVTLAGALLGPELMFVRLRWLQIAAGLVLLYFGWNWTKKSVIHHVGGKRAGWIQNPLGGRILEMENAASRFSYINFAVMTKSAAL